MRIPPPFLKRLLGWLNPFRKLLSVRKPEASRFARLEVEVLPRLDLMNAAPIIGSVTFDLPAPTTNQSLIATAHDVADADFDTVYCEFKFAVNNQTVHTVITSDTFASLDLSQVGNGDKGDVITVTVTPTDTYDWGNALSADPVIVANSPAAIGNVVFDNSTPNSNDVLTAAVVDFFDADGDSIMLKYQWYVNGQIVQTTTTAALSDTLDLSQPGFGSQGDDITVTVTPSDPFEMGSPIGASTTVVGIAPALTFELWNVMDSEIPLADGPSETPYTPLTVVVAGTGSYGETPTGYVTFTALDPYNGVSSLGVASVGVDGKAILQIESRLLDHAGLVVQAEYSGDDLFTLAQVTQEDRAPPVRDNPPPPAANAQNLTVVVLGGNYNERDGLIGSARAVYGAGAYIITDVRSIQDLGRFLNSFPAGSISRLVLAGHGVYSQADQPGADGTRGIRLGLSQESRFNHANLNLGSNATALAQIRSVLGNNPLIVLHGCNLAETAAGRNHLRDLAILFSGRVRGANRYVSVHVDTETAPGWITRNAQDAAE